jgi:Dyp-type peroxidase family
MDNIEERKRATGLTGMTNLNLLAPIKADMVVGFEPISYRERLRKVLNALQAARRNVRESEWMPPVFGDAVGRFGIIHNFRYSIVPPQKPATGGEPTDDTWRLSLNVSFDGGWEPYMRIIYRDLGTLLDLLLCHTVGYQCADEVTFSEYCAWVSEHEIEGGIFYTDSSATLADQAYLAKLEVMQREGTASDLDMARLGLPSAQQRKHAALSKAMSDPMTALVLPLRTLKGLHRMSVYFEDGDRAILSRFARDILSGTRALMVELLALRDPDPRSKVMPKLRALLRDELELLEPFEEKEVDKAPPKKLDRAALQSHILAQDEGISHGCVVLLRVADATRANQHLMSLAAKCGTLKDQTSGIGHLIAFTHAGLETLGVHSARLAALPQEFVDGMEARCGVLGDVRGNHPDYWPRPLAYGMAGSVHRIEMKSVHVLVQLRLSDPGTESAALHPRLQPAIDALETKSSGLRVLAVQATRSYRKPVPTAEGATVAGTAVGHFGFVDGISQPVIDEGLHNAKTVANRDLVSAGELLLGHANDRGDKANPALDELLKNGSFLVVRKLRQRVDHLHANLQNVTADEHDLLLTRMMGRPKNGDAPVLLPAGSTGPNDFDYSAPNASDGCPLQSHIRRANPRDGRRYTPRILRRGMSYGPQSTEDLNTERGVVFMAYCASLAEQFETIQRWVAGGNSTGASSAQADPFLRVPQQGENHTFRYVKTSQNGTSGTSVQRVVFDDKPLVQLEWGLYTFVPSLAVLRNLTGMHTQDSVAAPKQATLGKAASPEDPELEKLRQELEDKDRAPLKWKEVRDGTKSLNPPSYGRLIGTCVGVLDALKDRSATQFSVKGYGDRMTASVGLNHLGCDQAQGGYTIGRHVNAAIEAITAELAFAEATKAVQAVLADLPGLPPMTGKLYSRRSVDLVDFSDKVLAALCKEWVGLPDSLSQETAEFIRPGGRKAGSSEVPPRCPGNFATASRYIFTPYPRPAVESQGEEQGKAALKAVQDWLDGNRARGSLAIDINKRLVAADQNLSNKELAPVLSGVLLGFPPTVHGNFIRTMESWVESEQFWQLQQKLMLAAPQADVTYEQAKEALRDALLGTMRTRPVPEMLWRSPVGPKGAVNTEPKHRVVLGITSALTDPQAPDELIFGRDDRDPKDPTAHGCPGMSMAMGVLLAMMAGLMTAGTLRPTGSPVLLILTPRA